VQVKGSAAGATDAPKQANMPSVAVVSEQAGLRLDATVVDPEL
jgi:hypothetical protein